MVEVTYRKFGFRIRHIWFYGSGTVSDAKQQDIIYYHAVKEDNAEGIVNKQYSLISDLEQDEEQLWKGIRKNFRYQIRRAEKENIEVRTFRGLEIRNEEGLFDKFVEIYNTMYKDKHMKTVFNVKLVTEYMKENRIIFTIACADGEPLVFHSYLYDNDKTRLFYSASPFREETEQAVKIGRMNKYLHWRDLLFFKNMGVKEYDWGGIFSFTEPNGIDHFKQGFGGVDIEYYNIVIGTSFLGKVIEKLMALRSRK